MLGGATLALTVPNPLQLKAASTERQRQRRALGTAAVRRVHNSVWRGGRTGGGVRRRGEVVHAGDRNVTCGGDQHCRLRSGGGGRQHQQRGPPRDPAQCQLGTIGANASFTAVQEEDKEECAQQMSVQGFLVSAE